MEAGTEGGEDMAKAAREIGRTVRRAIEGWQPTARLIVIMGAATLLIAVVRIQQ
jgi:hypothetical protein